MGIKQFAEEEMDLSEFEDVWEEWRKVSKNITSNSDHKVRDLHASMGMMLSHKQMMLALAESKRDKQDVVTDLKESYLVACSDYREVAVSIRKSVVKDDVRYKEEAMKLIDLENNVTVIKGECNALFTSVTALSRELSARMK